MRGQFCEANSCFWSSHGGKITVVQIVFKGLGKQYCFLCSRACFSGKSLRWSKPALIKNLRFVRGVDLTT